MTPSRAPAADVFAPPEQLPVALKASPRSQPAFHGQTFDAAQDFERLKRQLDRVRDCLGNGEWWTLRRLQEACGGEVTAISARIRQVRREGLDRRRNGHLGWVIQLRRVPGYRGLFQYRRVFDTNGRAV